jgi:hypothetical protein
MFQVKSSVAQLVFGVCVYYQLQLDGYIQFAVTVAKIRTSYVFNVETQNSQFRRAVVDFT